MSGLVELARFFSVAEASVARGRLAADGIESVLFDSGMAGCEGVWSMIPVRLMVLDEDEVEARAALGEFNPD